MTLSFGPEICGDPAAADQREWLVTNGLGGYACGTVSGCLTRSYHGLLITARHPPVDRLLLLSRLEEAVETAGQTFVLSTNRWADGRVEPRGHRLIESFALEGTVPRWRYRLADALLEKRIWMEPGSPTTYISYRLLEATTPLRLTLAALVHPRSHHGGAPAGPLVLHPIAGGVRVTTPEGSASLVLRTDRGRCRPEDPPLPSDPLLLNLEACRGLPCHRSDRRVARLEAVLTSREPWLTVVASTAADPSPDGVAALARRRRHEEELIGRWHRAQPELAPGAPGWIGQLVLAADAFVVARPRSAPPAAAVSGASGASAVTPEAPGGASLIAGYPWFSDWGRDTMISLCGLTLVTGRPEIAGRILRTWAASVRFGLLPNAFPDTPRRLPEAAADAPDPGMYNTVDATLWFFIALREHLEATGDPALVADLFPVLEEIIERHRRGTLFGIRVDPADGLLASGEGEVQLTWMDARPDLQAVTPRHGKPVEVNALWINALGAMAAFARRLGRDPAPYDTLAGRARQGFRRFWNGERGHCFDVLDGPGGQPDASLRPNQLLALSLPDVLLSPEQGRGVLTLCARRLYTPHGLRTLDPAHPAYRGHYGGDVFQRDGAYHQGTVWAWWLGPFARAHARVHGDRRRALGFLTPIRHHLAAAGVGSISEIFDGDPPFHPRGCIAQAWSVAEVLRSWVELSRPGDQARYIP